MTETPPDYLALPEGRAIAYRRTPGKGPGLVFLSGFMSDMSGSKATHLEAYARARGRAFLRFDYFGHGLTPGPFAEGGIGRWAGDALAVLDALTDGPQVLVGSSMGGWLTLLTALARPERVAALVGIAAAPDFTEDLIWDRFSPAERERLLDEGRLERPSDYGAPYLITRHLIEEARSHLVLRAPIPLACPVRLLHGTADADVPFARSLTLLERLESRDVELTLVKDGDHRMSDARALALLDATLDRLLAGL